MNAHNSIYLVVRTKLPPGMPPCSAVVGWFDSPRDADIFCRQFEQSDIGEDELAAKYTWIVVDRLQPLSPGVPVWT